MTDWETRAKQLEADLRSVRDRLITESMYHAHGVKMRLLDIASTIKLPGEVKP